MIDQGRHPGRIGFEILILMTNFYFSNCELFLYCLQKFIFFINFRMPRIGLKIDCCLENLCSLEAPGEDFRWFLKINCGACGEVTDWVYVSQEEQIPVKGMVFLFNCSNFLFFFNFRFG